MSGERERDEVTHKSLISCEYSSKDLLRMTVPFGARGRGLFGSVNKIIRFATRARTVELRFPSSTIGLRDNTSQIYFLQKRSENNTTACFAFPSWRKYRAGL